MQDRAVDKVWLTNMTVWEHTTDDREVCERFVDCQRLKFATPEQKSQLHCWWNFLQM